MTLLPFPTKNSDTVPVVEISIELPRIELAEGQVVLVAESPLRDGVRELVLGIVLTTTIRHYQGRWSPMDYELFREVAMNGPWTNLRRQVARTFLEMATEEVLSIVEVGDKMYVVPTQALAQEIQQSRVGTL